MTTVIFIFSVLLFLLWLIREGRRKKKQGQNKSPCLCSDLKEAAIENIQQEKERQARAKKEYEFYIDRIKELQEIKQRALTAEQQARQHYNTLKSFNQYGSVINERQITRAENTLYHAQRKRMTIENQILIAERGRNKAIDKMIDRA